MIDNMFYQLKNLSESTIDPDIINLKHSLPNKYICMTLHRPSNVDSCDNIKKILMAIRAEFSLAWPKKPLSKKGWRLGHIMITKAEW
jgi:UDP-N-acetylglucosamine 2-epimerase (non-hydrolysing)